MQKDNAFFILMNSHAVVDSSWDALFQLGQLKIVGGKERFS